MGDAPDGAHRSRRRSKLMFYSDGKLQYPVRVERPNPVFARALQQAIGGVEGEIRVMMQYLFQAWGNRGPKKYRDMLLNTGTEEIGHVEMLSTAVALNLEGAPLSFQHPVHRDGRDAGGRQRRALRREPRLRQRQHRR